jgi:hypothetical protein
MNKMNAGLAGDHPRPTNLVLAVKECAAAASAH